jgi:integrase/recombinase XerD
MSDDGALVAAHIRYLERLNRRPRTIQARRDVLRRFANYSGVQLLDTTRPMVEAYIDQAQAPATKRVYLSHLVGFFAWACDEEFIDTDPTRRVARARIPARLPRPIPEHDLAIALAAAEGHIRAWIILGAWAGLRACEIGPVRGEHVIRGANPTLVIPESKGGGMSAVPLAPMVVEELERWPSTGWMWKENGPFHYIVVTRHITQHFQRLGMSYTCHQLRHRYGTMLYRASGHDIRVTQTGMRHLSIASTALYTKVDDEQVANAVALLPRPA